MPGTAPWNPDRRWADPFIALLTLLIVLMLGATFRTRVTRPAPPPDRVQLQGRLADLSLGAAKVLGPMAGGALARADSMPKLVAGLHQGWDRAVLAVHAAEKGDLDLGARLAQDAPGGAGAAFRTAWSWGYRGEGRAPAPAELAAVRQALGAGCAAEFLEARCAARSGGDPKPYERRAEAWLAPRLAMLGALSGGALLLGLGGLAFLVVLAVTTPRPRTLPRFGMSGRAVLIVLLGWFLTHLMAGWVIGLVLAAARPLRPLALPLTYLFHAGLGTAYLCWAEGLSWRQLARKVAPGAHGRAVLQGVLFLALAFAMVMLATLAVSPFLRSAEPPQRELMDMLSRLRGPLTVTLVFLTVAVLAPVFEELLFRGFMLPWLGERMERTLGRRLGWTAAVAVSGLTFAAMHLQPMGLPTLGTLGLVLGLAFFRTGNLLTSIVVHGIWNGGIFLLLRLAA